MLAFLISLLSLAAPERPADPWVFRCVLDGRPRMAVVALSDRRYLAYDLASCGLAKVWVPDPAGGVDLTGTVYDNRHGPQPRSRGRTLLTREDAWSLRSPDGEITPANARFLGYTLDGTESVTFRWRITADERIYTIAETPRLEDGRVLCRFTIEPPPEGVGVTLVRGAGGDAFFTLDKTPTTFAPVAP